MKTHILRIVLPVILVSASSSPQILWGQNPPAPRPTPPPNTNFLQRGSQRMLRPAVADPLTDEARAVMREAMDATREEALRLTARIREVRHQINEAIYAPQVDEGKIQDLGATLGRLESDYALIRSRSFAKVRDRLTPEQINILKTMPIRPELFDRPPAKTTQRPNPATTAPGRPSPQPK